MDYHCTPSQFFCQDSFSSPRQVFAPDFFVLFFAGAAAAAAQAQVHTQDQDQDQYQDQYHDQYHDQPDLLSFADTCLSLPFFAAGKSSPSTKCLIRLTGGMKRPPLTRGLDFAKQKAGGERSRFLSSLLPPKSYPVKALHDRRNAFTVPGSDPSYTAPGRWLPDPTVPWQVPCPHSDNARVQR